MKPAVPDASGRVPDGIRYYLPQPVVVVRPKKDGSVAVTVEMIPDTSRAYAISSRTLLGRHKLAVEVDDRGLLKKVALEGESTEVAKAQIESAAGVAKARLEAETAAAKAASESAAKRKATVAAALAAAEATLRQARLELAQAEAVLATMLENATGKENPDVLMKARTEVARTRAAYLAAEAEVDRLRDGVEAGRAAMSAAVLRGEKSRAWGPMLFRVVSEDERVELVPAGEQRSWPTSSRLDEP